MKLNFARAESHSSGASENEPWESLVNGVYAGFGPVEDGFAAPCPAGLVLVPDCSSETSKLEQKLNIFKFGGFTLTVSTRHMNAVYDRVSSGRATGFFS